MSNYTEIDHLKSEISDLQEEVSSVFSNLSEIAGKIKEHDVRFGNDREVMTEMKHDIAALKPKTPDWLKLLGVLAGVFVASLGAHYWLIEQLNDRPTYVQIEKAFHGVAKSGLGRIVAQL